MFNFCSSTSSNKDQPNKKPNTINLLLTFNLSMVAWLRVESEWFIFTEISIKIFLKTKNLFIQGKHFVFLLLWMFLPTFQLKEGTLGPSDDFSFFTSEAVTFVRWKTVDATASITWLAHSELLAFSQITKSKTQKWIYIPSYSYCWIRLKQQKKQNDWSSNWSSERWSSDCLTFNNGPSKA